MTTAGTPASERIFACGSTGSGKTQFLRDVFLPRHPRALILDATGEWEREKGVRVAYGFPELLAELRRAAGARRWRIVASLDDADVPKLAALLCPTTSAKNGSLALALGGVALLSDELATVAGHDAPAEVRALWRMGRHVGLSILGATQRPAECARVCTAMARWLVVCALHEPNDVKYLAKQLPRAAIGALGELPQYGAILWDNISRRGWLLDKDRRAVRALHTQPGKVVA